MREICSYKIFFNKKNLSKLNKNNGKSTFLIFANS